MMFLNTEMAWPWVIPCNTCPFIERISSPETFTVRKYFNEKYEIFLLAESLKCLDDKARGQDVKDEVIIRKDKL